MIQSPYAPHDQEEHHVENLHMSAARWVSKPLGNVCVFARETNQQVSISRGLYIPYLCNSACLCAFVHVHICVCESDITFFCEHPTVHPCILGSLEYLSMQVQCFSICNGLNNTQGDSKIEWMSVHLLLANFQCDLLHSSVAV